MPQLATTIASSSTTLVPTPRHQRLNTVGGWYGPIIQPFLSRFSSRRFCFQPRSQATITVYPGGGASVIVNLAWTCSNFSSFCLLYHTLGTKRMRRPSAHDPCTPRAERPPRQPGTLSVTVVGCSMEVWARTLRVDRGIDGFGRPSGAHFVVCSLLVLGPKYQILPSRRFCVTETPENRNA
jgi:hypothetical protein